MHEKRLKIEGIDPIEIYGFNNTYIDRLRSHYPKLKCIVRGDEIMLSGNLSDMKSFEEKLNMMSDMRKHRKVLNDDIIDSLFDSGTASDAKPANESDVILYGQDGRPIKARTKNQLRMLQASGTCDMIFAVGPAGSGKTYTAIAMAVRALKNREVRRIILTRPAVEAGERLGFLPGDLKDKLDPYLQPLYDALIDMIPSGKLKGLMEDGTIQIAPLAYMRGRTLDNAFVILDEAQNTTESQMKMFLTRMGNNAKFIITGDMTQIDLPDKERSGLASTLEIMKGIKGIAVIRLTKDDIVRHPLVTKIIKAFEKI